MRHILLGAIVWAAAIHALPAEEYWPQWRGPSGTGAAEAGSLPTSWSETENVIWKVELPSWSGATPIIWGDRIFLTSPEPSGRTAPTAPARAARFGGSRDPGGPTLFLLCLNRADGRELWRRDLGEGNRLMRKQNMSSPSPVTDGERLWVMTGTGLLRCFDFDGEEIWKLDVEEEYGKFGINWGYASSPLLWEDRLIIPVLHGMKTDEPSYMLAIDKATGKELWRTIRPTDAIRESPDSYATPQLLTYEGRSFAVMNGGDVVTAHDLLTGEEVWRVRGMNPRNNPSYRVIASSVVIGDTIFAPTRVQPLTAIRAGGHGDVTDSHVLWRARGSDVPSPVSDGNYLWIADDRGVFSCIDAKTGELMYDPQRIATGTYSSSLLLADGKIYATSESATTTVLAAGPEFNVLATNRLDDPYTLSSLIAVGNRIYIRTSAHLYCIGEE